MDTKLYKITEICNSKNIESTFLRELSNYGLIELHIVGSEEFVYEDQLIHIDTYCNWHYELELNMEGIEIVHNLLEKIKDLKREIRLLRLEGNANIK